VAHQFYRELPVERLTDLLEDNPVLIDVKGIYDPQQAQAVGMRTWRL
jgi:UDP-N-acetyl-D-galactosamine dehydrogenase